MEDDLDGLRYALALIDAAIERREAELKDLHASRRHLIALVPQRSMLPPAETSAPRRPPQREDHGPLPTSVSKACEVVLRRHNSPMDADDLARALVAAGHKYEGTITNLAATVRGVLGREIRTKGESTNLVRVGRGMFGLREWTNGVQRSLVPAQVEAEDEDRQESETA